MPFWKADRSAADLARWSPPPSTFVELDGMRVHVRDEGPRTGAPAIVLMHGTGNSLHTWEAWVAKLKERYRVVSFDRPGFGLTGPHPAGDYSMVAYAAFVRRLLDRLGIEKGTLVGNSAGGRVAWRTAVATPERVERLVLIAASGYPRSASRSLGFTLAMSPLGPFLLHVLPKSAIANNIRGAYGDPAKVTPELIDRCYEVNLREGVRDAMGATLRQADAVDDAELIKEIGVPTLIMWGDKDAVLPVTDAARFKADIPGSDVVIFPGLGHLPQEEAPGVTLAAFEAFMAKPAYV